MPGMFPTHNSLNLLSSRVLVEVTTVEALWFDGPDRNPNGDFLYNHGCSAFIMSQMEVFIWIEFLYSKLFGESSNDENVNQRTMRVALFV